VAASGGGARAAAACAARRRLGTRLGGAATSAARRHWLARSGSTLPSPSLSSVQQQQLRLSLSEWVASFPAWAAQLADPGAAAGSALVGAAGPGAGAVPCRRCKDLPLPLPAWASREKAGLTEALGAGGYVATRPLRRDHVVQLNFDAGVWRSAASRGVDVVVAQAAAAALARAVYPTMD